MKKKYSILLLDCDGTLLDFDRAEAQALRKVFEEFHIEFQPEFGILYHQINDACWKALERGEITKPELQRKRFRDLEAALPVSFPADSMGMRYMELLGEGSDLLPGALEICRELSRTYSLYLVTNGVARTQENRLNHSGIKEYIRGMFVSEAVGVAKPDFRYFQYVFAHIPGFRPEQALMVGDSLTSDIRGGINAGIDTCWVNAKGEPRPAGWPITYEIADIRGLRTVLEE